MQTRKRISGKSVPRNQQTPRSLRSYKKLLENAQSKGIEFAQAISSSPQKHSCGSALGKTYISTAVNTDINGYELPSDNSDDLRYCNGTENTGCNNEDAPDTHGTIFSPTFCMSKVGGEMANGANFQMTKPEEQESEAVLVTHGAFQYCTRNEDRTVTENNHCSVDTGVCEEDDYEEYSDFDPYIFIKKLPELSSIVPTFRPTLLPKQTRSCPRTTLVLDLDETLVHSTLEHCEDADFTFPVHFNLQEHTVYVRCRPHLNDFLDRVSRIFEIIVFTASLSIYAEQLLNVLDPGRRIFRHRVYRESCVFVDGNYLKDLSVLGRDLSRVIIIDNSPQAFGFQVDNGIPIETWFDDPSDKELLSLLPFLESLAGAEDVRLPIAEKFNLRARIASVPAYSFH